MYRTRAKIAFCTMLLGALSFGPAEGHNPTFFALNTQPSNPPAAFFITGITGGTNDTIADDLLTDGTIATVTWEAATGATSYSVSLRDANGTLVTGCTSSKIGLTGLSTTFTGCVLTADAVYKIDVVATNGVTRTANNSLFAFTVYSLDPGPFSILGVTSSPNDTSVDDCFYAPNNISATPTITWTASANATNYEISIVDLTTYDVYTGYSATTSGSTTYIFAGMATHEFAVTVTATNGSGRTKALNSDFTFLYLNSYLAAGPSMVNLCSTGTSSNARCAIFADNQGLNTNYTKVNCNFLFQPPGGGTITAQFQNYGTRGSHVLTPYDGTGTGGTNLGGISGDPPAPNPPSDRTGTSGSMFFDFVTGSGPETGLGWWAVLTRTIPALSSTFNISGIKSADGGVCDAAANNVLSCGLNPRIEWSTLTGASGYNVVIRDADDRVIICSGSTTAAFLELSTCALHTGSTYHAYVNGISVAGATKDAGNTGYSFSVPADTTAPVLSAYSLSPGSPSAVAPTASGSCSDSGTQIPSGGIKVCAKSGALCSYPADFTFTGSCTGGSYSVLLSLANGTYDIEVAAVDANGNVSNIQGQGSANYIVNDVTAPNFAGWVTPSGSIGVTQQLAYVFSWNPATETGVGLATTNTYKVERFATSACGGAPAGTSYTTGNYYSYLNLTTGTTYSVRLTAYDQAGNPSSTSCSGDVTITLNAVTAQWNGGYNAGATTWTTSGTATYGTGDGMFRGPGATWADLSGGYLYVLDRGNARINKFNITTGAFIGWIGAIGTSPTGGAGGCNGATVGTFTPGWCTGGTSTNGFGDGMLGANIYPDNFGGIVGDASGNLYVTDYEIGRISKYNASTGAFIGWIGKIGASPTGGAGGCNGAAAGTFTPGWCTGGIGSNGDGDGMMAYPAAVALDGSGNLFVADRGNGRINKYTVSTGAFQGWIGYILISPTGGAGGCNGATGFTPGWCTGGTGKRYGGAGYNYGPSLGAMDYPTGIAVDTSGNIYVVDYTDHNVKKFNSSGVYQGFIGGYVISGFLYNTSGWTISSNNSWNYTFEDPKSISVDSTNSKIYITDRDGMYTYDSTTGLNRTVIVDDANGTSDMLRGFFLDLAGSRVYAADYGFNRVAKYSITTGALQGWLGATVGIKNTWSSTQLPIQTAQLDGTISQPKGVAVDSSGNMYVSEAFNYRVLKFSSSGSFVGWIGKINTSPTGGTAGCSGAATDTQTPGWCTGGTAKSSYSSGTYDGSGGFYYPSDIEVDSTNDRIYIRNQAGIAKYVASTGAFVGWIGTISGLPTGGAAGCTTARTGNPTPGWCTGGTIGTPNGYGPIGSAILKAPDSISLDVASDRLYVLDVNSIKKYIASTGAYLGWIGRINLRPNGGAAGCTTAESGDFTPGWCLGGVPKSGTDSAINVDAFENGRIAMDPGNGLIFLNEDGLIKKYNASTGTYLGWIGKILTSPTSGDAGCAGASVGSFTPGWCKGGTPNPPSNTDPLAINNAYGLDVDSTGKFLYVADNRAIKKYLASTGAFSGWLGKVQTSPTGGYTGCSSTTYPSITPGYCSGGTGASDGDVNGEMLNIFSTGLTVTGSYVYSTDYGHNRVNRFSNP